jgi:D-glycero-alpha-D-manno-heptose-7-phosphate kinase
VIITRTPLRITLGGGGTDLPNFYERHGGFILAMAIDKYIHVSVEQTAADSGILLNYEEGERAAVADELKHDLTREALVACGYQTDVEITPVADIPGGTGLGSSGAYLVGLLHALRAARGETPRPDALAEEACRIEMDVLARSVGKQDQYVAAHGGLSVLRIGRDGAVAASQLPMSAAARSRFVANNHLYFTGTFRRAHDVLDEQRKALAAPERAPQVSDAMLRIRDLGYEILDAVGSGDFDRWGELMHSHWCEKRKLSSRISVAGLDELYDEARERFGVRGGKIIGAGGGGFVLMYADRNHETLETFMRARGLPRIHYEIAAEGTKRVPEASVRPALRLEA